MKNKTLNIIIIVLFLVGLSVLLYPAVSEYINAKHASRVTAEYNDAVSNANAERLKEVFDAANAYNQQLAKTTNAFYMPELVPDYQEQLNLIGNGVMGSISIEKIKVELPIYHGVDKNVLQIGAGHLEGTSLPIGGRGSHCVISGHRGLPSAKLFTDLDELELGDVFTISVLNQKLTYCIDQIKTVLPTETDDLQIVSGKDYCTLITCTPYGINTHRLLVRGERIASADEKPGIYVANEAFQIDPLIVTPIAAMPMLLVLLILTFAGGRKKRHADPPSDGKEKPDTNE